MSRNDGLGATDDEIRESLQEDCYDLQAENTAYRARLATAENALTQANATVGRLEAQVETLEYALRDIHSDLSPRSPRNKYPPKFARVCETVERTIKWLNESRDEAALAPPAAAKDQPRDVLIGNLPDDNEESEFNP